MKTTTLVVPLSVLILGIATEPAVAGEPGFFAGGSLGQSTVKRLNVDADDTAWKILGGYNWQLGNKLYVGVEGSYTDFGKASQSFLFGGNGESITNDYEFSGFGAWSVAGFSLGSFDLYGKLGFVAWDGDLSTNRTILGQAVRVSDSGTDTAYGIGAAYNIGRFAVRGEWERLEIDNIVDRIETLTIGVTYRF